jgi:iron complex outermembrane receptor protein
MKSFLSIHIHTRFLIFFFFFCFFHINAEVRDTLQIFPSEKTVAGPEENTVSGYSQLEGVTVVAEIPEQDKFSGTSVLTIDKEVLTSLQHTSLSELLAQHTPVFIKESGHGMLSTISLRGTASSHTAVTWNGITINPLTMGQVDFSQLPLFFFDNIAVHPGGESAIHGNGAIGGAITLSSTPDFGKNFSYSIQETAGAYGYTFTGLKLYTGNKKIQSKSAFFFNRSDNNFSFVYRDEEKKQKNAAYHNYGLLEELDFRPGEKHLLGLKLWHTYFFREIQPSMQNNEDISKYEEISDRSTRIMADYTFNIPVLLKAKVSWLNDHQEFQKDIIATHTFIGNISSEKNFLHLLFINEFDIKAGAGTQYIYPEVYSYQDGIDEWRTHFFVYMRMLIIPRWELTCNFRQELINDMDIPFTPSIGTLFKIVNNKTNILSLRGNISRSYNVPTLNDRYWGDMNNKYLLPEDGLNTEIGFRYKAFFNKYNLSLEITGYKNKVSNWIMWMPYGNVWKPQNIDKVESSGIEVNSKQTFPIKNTRHLVSVNYAYNHAEVKEGFDEMRPFRNRQVPLLPEHTLSSMWHTQFRKFTCSLQGSYTGKRSTSDIFDILDAYFTVNFTAGYEFYFKKNLLAASLNIHNIFDTSYQNMPFRAMPGRHLYISLTYTFNPKKAGNQQS